MMNRSRTRRYALAAAFLAGALFVNICVAQVKTIAPSHTFVVSGNEFLLDGKPYQIRSGEMHYPRVPRAYWRDRFRKARAMGLNTITTYVFWNLHEPAPGQFDFTGDNDLAEYLREAQQEGLNVILRPGPYVCAEWDLGGYPAWLLKDHSLVLRSHDPKFLAAQDRWLARLGTVVKPFLIQNGGPIIAVQIENEHGSFDKDTSYVAIVRDQLLHNGIETAVMYTADGPGDVPYGGLPGVPAVINFGTGDAEKSFAKLATIRPDGPRMSGEYWAGWFDHWGEAHHVTNPQTESADYAWMIDKGYSVSLYMEEGGTSFGWMNGANSRKGSYEPDTTSYDYNAPLDEAGNPREKYFLIRAAIEKVTGETLPPVPPQSTRKVYTVDPSVQSASLWDNLPKPIESDKLLTMEDLGQNYGFMLYRTMLAAAPAGDLIIDGLHDFAQIYLDGKLIGTLDRRLAQTTMPLPAIASSARLDVLVENNGRINYTTALREERKGVVGSLTAAGQTPAHWQIFSLPMVNTGSLHYKTAPCSGPCFYRTSMQVDAGNDTYLDTHKIHQGFVWINGIALGRAWDIGPQLALYAPGPWLTHGSNSVVFFDLRGDSTDAITSVLGPSWSSVKPYGH